MTKRDIIEYISKKLLIPRLKATRAVQCVFDLVSKTIIEEKRIELRGFGVFEIKIKPPRQARNPRTGEKVTVPERYKVTFKASKELLQLIESTRGET